MPKAKAQDNPPPSLSDLFATPKIHSIKLCRTAVVGNRTTGQFFECDGAMQPNGQIARSFFLAQLDLSNQVVWLTLSENSAVRTMIPFSNVDWIKFEAQE